MSRPYAVIALGNPLLCDDTAALVALRLLRDAPLEAVDLIEDYAGGMDLLPALEGREGVVVVDAVRTLAHEPGTCLEFTLEDLDHTRQARLVDTHGMNLATVIGTGRNLGYAMPRRLAILGIEGRDFTTFQETPSRAVMEALPSVAARIERTLREWEERR